MSVELADDALSLRSRDGLVTWLGAAILVHALLMVGSRFIPPPSHAPFAAAHASDATEIAIETVPEIAANPANPVSQTQADPTTPSAIARRDEAARSARAVIASLGHTGVQDGTQGISSESVITQAAPNAGHPEEDKSGWSISVTSAPKDIGVGANKSAFTNGFITRASAEAPPPTSGSAAPLNQSLRQAMVAHDLAMGMGRGGVVLSASHSAVSRSLVPDESYALIEVRFDSTGHATSARIVQNQNDRQSWDEAASEIMKELQGHTARVPEGAAGLAVFVRVDVALKLPSGAGSGVTFGGGGHGMLGLTGDLSDIGQSKKRVVATRIVSEEIL